MVDDKCECKIYMNISAALSLWILVIYRQYLSRDPNAAPQTKQMRDSLTY